LGSCLKMSICFASTIPSIKWGEVLFEISHDNKDIPKRNSMRNTNNTRIKKANFPTIVLDCKNSLEPYCGVFIENELYEGVLLLPLNIFDAVAIN